MGKATELDERLIVRALSADEIKEREAAAKRRSGRTEATNDGTIIDVSSEAPEVIIQAPQGTWE